jgi:hypothetical protein
VNTFKILQTLYGDCNLKQRWSYSIHEAIRVGDRHLSAFILNEIAKLPNYRFNELHHNVLLDYKEGVAIPDFKSVSVTKQATNNLKITPMHFACINPNVNVLK